MRAHESVRDWIANSDALSSTLSYLFIIFLLFIEIFFATYNDNIHVAIWKLQETIGLTVERPPNSAAL